MMLNRQSWRSHEDSSVSNVFIHNISLYFSLIKMFFKQKKYNDEMF